MPRYLLHTFVLAMQLAFAQLTFTQPASAEDLLAQRLTWAGLKLELADTVVLIDPVDSDLWNGEAPGGLVPIEVNTRRRYALLTHLHNDHFDPPTLKRVLGDTGYVICHESMASHVASRGFRVIAARDFEPVSRGGFLMTPVPAVDGFGDRQVSWIVTAGGRRIIHAGDTLWHGLWPTLGAQYGPFDAAFLPINGARVGGAEIAAVMTPLQAVNAARQLQAKVLVPIHYGLNDPPSYVELAEALSTLRGLAQDRDLTVAPLKPGARLRW